MPADNMVDVKAAAIPDQMMISAFMASIPDRVYFMDRESRFVSLSLSMAQFLGCTDIVWA